MPDIAFHDTTQKEFEIIFLTYNFIYDVIIYIIIPNIIYISCSWRILFGYTPYINIYIHSINWRQYTPYINIFIHSITDVNIDAVMIYGFRWYIICPIPMFVYCYNGVHCTEPYMHWPWRVRWWPKRTWRTHKRTKYKQNPSGYFC